MILNGSVPDPWAKQFSDDYMPLVVQLILSSWETFKIPDKLLENPITKKFCAHLRNNKERDKHFFRIEWESTEIDNEGKELGRIDLKFIGLNSCDEKVYFSMECKRLHVTFPNGQTDSLAQQYVEEGMYRYFNGQYATNLNKGGMLGYVMDGDTVAAMFNVEKAIMSRRNKLFMKSSSGFRASTLIANDLIKETHHSTLKGSLLIIHHIFLPVKIK